jgi:2-methylcitrate dehydratase PrpD
MSLSTALADWVCRLHFRDLPSDVVEATRRRVLDTIGLSLAGAATPIGTAARSAALALAPVGPCTILGSGEKTGPAGAALANGTCSQALEFDDTHLESIVHMSSPSFAAALAIAEARAVSGADLITAVALGNEVACRVGSAAAGQFHKRGFHPTGLFGAFGAAALSARLLGLDAAGVARALGICGSFASGILECWTDGTDTKFLHAGWAAQSGIVAAGLAQAGATGPVRVFEGRFGFFASHLQAADTPPDLQRITASLGDVWESRQASFKPFPAAHVIHPYIDAMLYLRRVHGITLEQVAWVDCPVASYIVGIVCEPVAEKVAPATTSHCRVSLQYTLAEALAAGSLGRDAYADAYRLDPAVLALAGRVRYHVEPTYPGPGRFKGGVRITLNDGRTLERVEEHTRGSREHPMTDADLRAKFDDNAAAFLDEARRDRLVALIMGLEAEPDASVLAAHACQTPVAGS